MNKIQRNYCATKTSSQQSPKVNDDSKLKEQILEVLESPDKMERDHKHYRSAFFTVENVITSYTLLQSSQTEKWSHCLTNF